jgi:hypothetical protein
MPVSVAIMQPYFLPYIGYFQLLNAVDIFVLYDNIKYTKRGWINRNRILLEGRPVCFTVPLKKGPDELTIGERRLADDYDRQSAKVIRKMRAAYAKAHYFSVAVPAVERAFHRRSDSLFELIHESLLEICRYLGISTTVTVSSSLGIDHTLKGQDKVIAICEHLKADRYINPIGGTQLYAKESFGRAGIDLRFLEAGPITYRQYDHPFVPSLSIVDVMMFNPVERIRDLLEKWYALH